MRATRFAAVLVAAGAVAVLVSMEASQLSRVHLGGAAPVRLPQPIRQPITSTSAGAQVAWLWVQSQSQKSELVGDGRTIYTTSDEGSRLLVMRDSGSGVRSVTLPGPANGFIASKHG